MTNPLPPFDDLPPPPPALDQPPTPLASLSADVAAHAAHSGSGGKASLHSTLRHLHLVDSPSRSAADELSGSMRPDSPANYAATSLHQCDPAEKAAFVKHINDVLVDAVELQHVLPIDPKSEEIFSAVSDGILLGKLINASVPDTIDESKMIMRFRDERSRTYHQLQNHLLCIEGARRIGAKIVNVGPEDLVEGKPYLVFGLLWQIIKVGLLKDISVSKHPEMFADMADAGVDMSKLPAEELLLKWFNWHLKKCKSGLTVTNFSADMKVTT